MKKITASEGKYLTQKELKNEDARTFSVSLYLADNDSEDNWIEATQEEYYEWQKKQEQKFFGLDENIVENANAQELS